MHIKTGDDMVDLSALTTEQRNPLTLELDTFSPMQIARAMNLEDRNAVKAVEQVLPQVACAIELAAKSLSTGGRIIYLGAGTSGRLGVLDAVECPPTFGVEPDVVVGLIAGGRDAFVEAKEGAEDDSSQGEQDLRAIGINQCDFVIGLTASGRTPYVIGGIEYARALGCNTAAIACVPSSAVGSVAALAIEPITGPEVLTGSTRLKAGTAQKLILNMISTGAMTLTGKVYQNLMVDVKQTNEKLHARARNIIMEACGCAADTADRALGEANGQVKLAVASILLGAPVDDARKALETARGHIREAINAQSA